MAASPPQVPARIFISYRRDDTAYPAGWLFDRLAVHFRDGQVFKDVDSIELGDDFVEVITRAVGSCDVLLALIGNQWLTITDDDGRRRLDNPDDFVRLELEAALTRNVRVIPILIDEASMPRADELPPSLAGLVRRQALELSPNRFDFDTSRLLKVLDRTLAEVRTVQFGALSTAPPEAPPEPSTTKVPEAPAQRKHAPRHLTPGLPPGNPREGATAPSRAKLSSQLWKPPNEQHHRSKRARVLAGAGAGIVLVAVLIIALVLRPEPSVTIPQPGGASVADAKALLLRAGLSVAEKRETNETVAVGKLIRTSPPAGTQLQQGAQVTLVVSSGPKVTPLPAGTDELVVGYTARFASSKNNPDSLLEGFVPILFADPDTGKLKGLDYDIANALGKKLGVKISFKDAGHHTHMFSVVADRHADISMSVLRGGPKRNRLVEFAVYLNTGSALLIPNDNPHGIRSLDDLCGKTVVRPIEMPPGSLIDQSHHCEATGKPGITLMSCPKLNNLRPNSDDNVPLQDCPRVANPLQLVIDGHVHAAVLDLPVAERLMDMPSISQQLMIAPPRVKSPPYAIAIRKGDTVVGEAVRSALRAIIADGIYDKILAKWDLQDFAVEAADVNGAP
jgi:ABC-type amino acid transport substrate-binding protein